MKALLLDSYSVDQGRPRATPPTIDTVQTWVVYQVVHGVHLSLLHQIVGCISSDPATITNFSKPVVAATQSRI
jgi:hypothetical protein